MISVFQDKFSGHPDGGNCIQASVASLLELRLDDVPHFLKESGCWATWRITLDEWLEKSGLYAHWTYGDKIVHFDGYFLATGPTTRGTHHMVIYKGNEMVHDPHPEGDGLVTIDSTCVFIPYSPTKLLK